MKMEVDVVSEKFCNERHLRIDTEIKDIKDCVADVKQKQDDYNTTIRNIYYTLLIIAFSTIITLLGVVLGRAIDFRFMGL